MANSGERTDIEAKIEEITNRIVRGKAALKNKEVFWYKIHRAITVTASTVTSAGFSHPILSMFSEQGPQATIQAAFGHFHGVSAFLAIGGTASFIVLKALEKYYVSSDFEKKAIQAISLHENFKRFELQLYQRLANEDPLTQLNQIHEAVLAIEDSSHMVMPDYDKFSNEVTELSQRIINKFCNHWNSNKSLTDRRS